MQYGEFKEYIKNKIKDYLPQEYQNYEVNILKGTKNNGVVKEGISIRGKEPMVPLIYLESFFNAYQDGVKMEDIMRKISDAFLENCKPTWNFSVKDIPFEGIKDRIHPVVYNAALNQSMLGNIPHEIREDLAIVYRADVKFPDNDSGSMLINNALINYWGIDADILKEIAWDNMHSTYQPYFSSMADLLKSYGLAKTDMALENIGMYVLSNDRRCLGAAYMFDDKIMAEIADLLKSDLVVLPSSTHEVIILRAGEDTDFGCLREMVKEMNSTQLSPEEVLSNEVYLYDSQNQTITMVGKEQTQGMNMWM